LESATVAWSVPRFVILDVSPDRLAFTLVGAAQWRDRRYLPANYAAATETRYHFHIGDTRSLQLLPRNVLHFGLGSSVPFTPFPFHISTSSSLHPYPRFCPAYNINNITISHQFLLKILPQGRFLNPLFVWSRCREVSNFRNTISR
jgi:hypothetical protein